MKGCFELRHKLNAPIGECDGACGSIGTYVPTCPFRRNVVTGKMRGDEVADTCGYALYMDDIRFGSDSVPSLPGSPML